MDKKIIVGISQGDSNGISYEIIIKALSDTRILDSCIPVIYGSAKIFNFYKKTIHNIGNIELNIIQSCKDVSANKINIINCVSEEKINPGQASIESAKASLQALDCCIRDARAGLIDVMVTAPINKHACSQICSNFTGHTEYLKQQFEAENVAMILASDILRVGLQSCHIALREVADSISKEAIINKLQILDKSLKQDFGINAPKIAVLGLNPHNGDNGLLGTEEQEIILPAIVEAQNMGINAVGPFSSDGYFGLHNFCKFDLSLAMYHDQGLIPFKALSFDSGVNYTAGLPVVRTSPDHGTAFEMACQDKADANSMRAAIFMGIDIFKQRIYQNKLLANKMIERKLEAEEKVGYNKKQDCEKY